MKLDIKKLIREEVKKVLNEGNSTDGLAHAVRFYNKDNSAFQGDPKIMQAMKDAGVTSQTVFQLAALFKINTFKVDYIRTGKLEAAIKGLHFEPAEPLKKALALKAFVLAMDQENGGDKTWPSRF